VVTSPIYRTRSYDVTLNFPASPVMARDLKLNFVSPPSHTVGLRLWPPVEGDQLCWRYTSKTWVPNDTSRDLYMPR
jgi:hypothetical protein